MAFPSLIWSGQSPSLSNIYAQAVVDPLWLLADPRLADSTAAQAMANVLDLVLSDWSATRAEIDIGHPLTRRLITTHRISTLLPLEAVPPTQRQWLRQNQIEIAASQTRIRAVATDLLDILDGAGIETRVLKGLATAELDYPDHLLRHTGDVDLAIRPNQLDHAIDLMRRHGYRDHPTPYSRYLLYGWTFDGPHGVEIDIHTRLFRRSPLSDLLFDGEPVALTKLSAPALPLHQRLVHAAGHFIIAPPETRRLSGFFDISRMMQNPALDLDAAREFADRLGVESLICAGLTIEAQLSQRDDALVQLARWRQPDWLERATRLTPRRRLVLDHLARYREVPPGNRLHYLPTWLLPDKRQRQLLVKSARRLQARALRRPR